MSPREAAVTASDLMFSIAQLTDPSGAPYAPDKAGKDNNFRGLTIFDNTIYVTKGSGSNGVRSDVLNRAAHRSVWSAVRAGQGWQGQQFSRPDHLRQHDLCHQGKRQ